MHIEEIQAIPEANIVKFMHHMFRLITHYIMHIAVGNIHTMRDIVEFGSLRNNLLNKILKNDATNPKKYIQFHELAPFTADDYKSLSPTTIVNDRKALSPTTIANVKLPGHNSISKYNPSMDSIEKIIIISNEQKKLYRYTTFIPRTSSQEFLVYEFDVSATSYYEAFVKILNSLPPIVEICNPDINESINNLSNFSRRCNTYKAYNVVQERMTSPFIRFIFEHYIPKNEFTDTQSLITTIIISTMKKHSLELCRVRLSNPLDINQLHDLSDLITQTA